MFREGEPATCFYVMIDGELMMSKRSGGVDVANRRPTRNAVSTSGPGRLTCHGDDHTLRGVGPADANRRGSSCSTPIRSRAFMESQFPMAVHLLVEGHKVGSLRQRQVLGQRERLLALGTITAGLTHQLNNPAAATGRAVADSARASTSCGTRCAMIGRRRLHAGDAASPGDHPG